MKKYENKAGRVKDYLKGIISLGVGVLLIIIGIVWIEILPLAIVLFVVGTPAVFTGIGLIIHNKKNNTRYYDPDAKPSSSSVSEGEKDWCYEFKKAIEDGITPCAYVRCYASWENGVIVVKATMNLIEDNFNTPAAYVKDHYKKVAKNCPHSSRLEIKAE